MCNSILQILWKQTLHGDGHVASSAEWDAQVNAIYECGKGLEETLRYLFHQKPSLENFVEWMHRGTRSESNEELLEDVLSNVDIIFFKENGYVKIQNTLTGDQCEKARKAILAFIGADINDATTWYRDHEEMRGLMLMFYHHPSLEIVRNSPAIRGAFEQLYETTKIHKVIDKVSFNPPETSTFKFKGSPLHWDVSLALPIPFKLQGLLYLNDVSEEGGAFCCVPGFHNKLENWLKELSPNTNPADEALNQLKPVPIKGNAGDFIIWHQALPHCASPNRSKTPRFVQYHTYDPDNKQD